MNTLRVKLLSTNPFWIVNAIVFYHIWQTQMLYSICLNSMVLLNFKINSSLNLTSNEVHMRYVILRQKTITGISYNDIYHYHYVVLEEKQDFFYLCVCVLSYLKVYLNLLRNSLFSWISCWLNYYSCYFKIASKTLEDSASGFSIDECTDNSHVTNCYYSHTVCGTTLIAAGTSFYSSASISRTSIGVQATPHLKTTGVHYKS